VEALLLRPHRDRLVHNVPTDATKAGALEPLLELANVRVRHGSRLEVVGCFTPRQWVPKDRKTLQLIIGEGVADLRVFSEGRHHVR
jgi:hypothetical protein